MQSELVEEPMEGILPVLQCPRMALTGLPVETIPGLYRSMRQFEVTTEQLHRLRAEYCR